MPNRGSVVLLLISTIYETAWIHQRIGRLPGFTLDVEYASRYTIRQAIFAAGR